MKETIIHAILIIAIAATALLAGRFDYECEFGTEISATIAQE